MTELGLETQIQSAELSPRSLTGASVRSPRTQGIAGTGREKNEEKGNSDLIEPKGQQEPKSQFRSKEDISINTGRNFCKNPIPQGRPMCPAASRPDLPSLGVPLSTADWGLRVMALKDG